MTPSDSAPLRQGTVVWFGLSLILFAVLAIAGSWLAGGEDVWQSFASVPLITVLGMLFLSLVNYLFRAIRWHICSLVIGVEVPFRRDLTYYIAGFALTMTPGKIGEAFRLYLLKKNHGYAYGQTAALALTDRLADAVALLVLCIIGLSYFTAQSWLIVGAFALLAVPMLIVAAPKMAEQVLLRLMIMMRAPRRLRDFGVQTMRQIAAISDWRVLFLTLILGVAGWLAEAYALSLVLSALGADIPLAACAFIFAASALAGALVLLPGGLGGTEASMVGLLVLSGVDMGAAVAATGLIRLTTLWFATGLGLIALPMAFDFSSIKAALKAPRLAPRAGRLSLALRNARRIRQPAR
ncbi:MAG TPA: lysylphosphatidylglycerol synthase transmembrane domain-containing protein [Microvirga sp.]|jgi:uncharacterized protein (TIRG00374 family)